MDDPPDFAAAVEEAQQALDAALAAYTAEMSGQAHAAPTGHGHHV
jgi:hypothetical protein